MGGGGESAISPPPARLAPRVGKPLWTGYRNPVVLRRTIALLVLTALAAGASALAAAPPAKVVLRSTSLGKVLVDARGHTVYLFEADKGRRSSCYGQCAAAWPPFLTAAAPLAGAGVKPSLLGTTKRRDGKLQVMYAGHPLYFFAEDTRAGQTRGEGIEHFGGGWYVVASSGAKVEQPVVAPPSTTTNGGGGYNYGP